MPVSPPTDEELLAAVARREVAALDALYDRYHRQALGLAARMLGDQQAAEDVIQEVFLAAWRRAAAYRPERGSVKTWLLAMTHHRAIDRARQRVVASAVADVGDALEDQRVRPVWQQALEEIRGEQIGAALAALPDEQRQAIELAYFAGKSQSEIAVLLGLPLGTVKGRTRLALDKLRGLLIGLREEPA